MVFLRLYSIKVELWLFWNIVYCPIVSIVNDLLPQSSCCEFFYLLKIQFSPSIAKLPEIENKKLKKGLLVRSDII